MSKTRAFWRQIHIGTHPTGDSPKDSEPYLSLGVPMVDDVQEAVRAHRIAHLDNKSRATRGRASLGKVDNGKWCPFHYGASADVSMITNR